MTLFVFQAHDSRGRRLELAGVATDPAEARRMAARAAGLLSRVGSPARWAGGRVTALDAATNRLEAVARVATRGRVRV